MADAPNVRNVNPDKADKDRLDTLYVAMPNYVRIVYGYVPAWAKAGKS